MVKRTEVVIILQKGKGSVVILIKCKISSQFLNDSLKDIGTRKHMVALKRKL